MYGDLLDGTVDSEPTVPVFTGSYWDLCDGGALEAHFTR
jgi:hypothetical protein